MKLSNNPATVASRRLQMRKRTQDDKHLPLLQADNVHLGQHTAGASNMAGTSGSAGASGRKQPCKREQRHGCEQHHRCERCNGREQLNGRERVPSCSRPPGREHHSGRERIWRRQRHFGLEQFRRRDPTNCCHVSRNTTGQLENDGNQVEPWSICTRSTSFGNGTLW
jgi:hypothetical protein